MNEKKIEPPAISDSRPQMTSEQMLVLVESVITTAVAYAPSPSDALLAVSEALVCIATACGVPMRELGASFTHLADNGPSTDEDVRAAREMIGSCWERARRIRGQSADIKVAIDEMKKKREIEGRCVECGRSKIEHSATNADMLRASGIVVCETFKSWGAGGHHV